MKKILFASALLLTSIFARGITKAPGATQKHWEGYLINGTIKGNTENAKVKLLDVSDETQAPIAIDSAIVKGGKFQLRGRVEEPALYILTITLPNTKLSEEDRNLAHKVYVENTTMTFDADAATMTSYYYAPERKGIPIVTGSATQEQSDDLRNLRKDVSEKLSVLNQKYLQDYHVPSYEGKEVTEIGIKYQNEIDQLRDRHNAITLKFIKEHADSPVAFDETKYLTHYGNRTVAQYNELLSILEPAWKGKKRFKKLKENVEIKKNMAIGEKLPDTEFLNEKGEKVMLSSILPKDKYSLVEFWASWCGPCRGEIPHLKKLKEKYPQFNIISISIDNSDSDWRKALKEENMSWQQINYPKGFEGAIESLYGISGIPAGFIVDKEGKIIACDMTGAALDKLLFQKYGK